MKKIVDIKLENNCFLLSFSCGNWARLYKFGKDVYTVTSEKLHKSTLAEIKIDVNSFFGGQKSLKQIKEKWT